MRSKLGIAAVAVLAAAHVAIWTVTLVVSPLGYDEAFILQAPLNLVHGLGYSTEDWIGGGANLVFDPTVSTGPLLGLPAALSFLLFGESVTAARIITLPFLLLLLWGLVVLGRRYAGWWGAAAALGVLLVINTRADLPFSVIYGSSDVLGEYAAAAMLVWALVILPRHRMLAGLAVGFAMLAKFFAAIAVPAFLIALLLVPAVARRRRRARIGEAAAFLGFVAIPNVAWELVKLVSLGPSGYGESLWSTIRFVVRSGSGVDGTNSGAYFDRLYPLVATWQFPTIVTTLLGAALIGLCLVGVWHRATDPTRAEARASRGRVAGFLSGVGVDVVTAAVTAGGLVVWWVVISSSLYVRHTYPILLWLVPVMGALAVLGLRRLARGGTGWRAAVAAAAVVAVVATAYGGARSLVAATESPGWSRADQQATADFVRSLDVPDVQGVGWWQAPDIRFLSGVVSRPIGEGTGPLVIGPMMAVHDPRLHDSTVELCRQTLFERAGYIVCELAPDATAPAVGP